MSLGFTGVFQTLKAHLVVHILDEALHHFLEFHDLRHLVGVVVVVVATRSAEMTPLAHLGQGDLSKLSNVRAKKQRKRKKKKRRGQGRKKEVKQKVAASRRPPEAKLGKEEEEAEESKEEGEEVEEKEEERKEELKEQKENGQRKKE